MRPLYLLAPDDQAVGTSQATASDLVGREGGALPRAALDSATSAVTIIETAALYTYPFTPPDVDRSACGWKQFFRLMGRPGCQSEIRTSEAMSAVLEADEASPGKPGLAPGGPRVHPTPPFWPMPSECRGRTCSGSARRIVNLSPQFDVVPVSAATNCSQAAITQPRWPSHVCWPCFSLFLPSSEVPRQ